MKALVVEDDLRARKMLQRLLASHGECTGAANGREALEAFCSAAEEGQPYDLICLDIMMPEMNGHEVLKSIRELEDRSGISENDRVKVIMTTALADHESVVEAVRGKCQVYLVKPIDMQRLLEEIETLGLLDESA